MARAPVYSIWILSLSLLAACTSQQREASGQDRPSIAGRDDWKTDFGKHTVPLACAVQRWRVLAGGSPAEAVGGSAS